MCVCVCVCVCDVMQRVLFPVQCSRYAPKARRDCGG